jgi:hypothetical protein
MIPAEAGIRFFKRFWTPAGIYPRERGDQGDTYNEFM